jgi:hypothetical protein
VEEHVDDVVAGGVVAPEPVFEPVGRVDEGVVLRDRERAKPDVEDPAQGFQRGIVPDVKVVVPDLARGERAGIDEHGRKGERERHDQARVRCERLTP